MEVIHLNRKLTGLDQKGGQVTMRFADGSKATADAVIGADGVHSIVRDIVVGPDTPIHRGRIAYRAVFPASLMDRDIGRSRTKWWGTDRHIVIYYTTKQKSEVYFVTSVPEPAEWLTKESWSAKGDVKELRAAYEGFHEDVRAVLGACPDCHKWAILERDPLRTWSDGNVVLLGDSCHPMTPYMAQGAATSIEDAAVLARCLSEVEGDDIASAFKRYEAHRKPRTSLVQGLSSANTWMKDGSYDTSWLYGYDAWNADLDRPADNSQEAWASLKKAS
jgi:salicylate hydroxylase/6-hydroxynicotinate 3-monooxygenase